MKKITTGINADARKQATALFARSATGLKTPRLGKMQKAILHSHAISSLSKEAFAWKKSSLQMKPIPSLPSRTNRVSSFRIDRHVPSRQTSNSCSSSG